MPFLLMLFSLVASPVYDMGPAQVDAYLASLRDTTATFEARLASVARDALGTPYADGPLGEGEGAQYDQDPLINLARVDCVTYVEQVVALAASSTYEEAFTRLQKIRYRDGTVDFAWRNHFLISDWLRNNPWCHEVTALLGVPTVSVTRTISKRDFFKRVDAPDLGQDRADEIITLSVIAPPHTRTALNGLKQPTLIVFVGKIDWLFALHCGIYLPGGPGGGKLYHASSKSGEVVAVDLAEYMVENASRYVGFSAHTIKAPHWAPGKDGNNEAE